MPAFDSVKYVLKARIKNSHQIFGFWWICWCKQQNWNPCFLTPSTKEELSCIIKFLIFWMNIPLKRKEKKIKPNATTHYQHCHAKPPPYFNIFHYHLYGQNSQTIQNYPYHQDNHSSHLYPPTVLLPRTFSPQTWLSCLDNNTDMSIISAYISHFLLYQCLFVFWLEFLKGSVDSFTPLSSSLIYFLSQWAILFFLRCLSSPVTFWEC